MRDETIYNGRINVSGLMDHVGSVFHLSQLRSYRSIEEESGKSGGLPYAKLSELKKIILEKDVGVLADEEANITE
ncbi:hypothetical protein CEXT_155641 [Caerostris extrusa]|uniref:Uncharacterized protein n=1 Tax=Caerostris extrusa TaxID=172846 RepID=A0AAV4MSK1_CAEEX|nr:hypothetical protein CEXT_155641 [Caerostris extrusa]